MTTYAAPTLVACGDIVRETRLGMNKVQVESFTTRPQSAGGVGFSL